MVRYKHNITFSLGVCGKISTQYKPRLRLGVTGVYFSTYTAASGYIVYSYNIRNISKNLNCLAAIGIELRFAHKFGIT